MIRVLGIDPGSLRCGYGALVVDGRALRYLECGTLTAPVHYIALAGGIGRDAHCTVYARRPSPCRELQPAWEHGAPSPQCDRARIAHGLAPLTPTDWPT